MNHNVIYLLLVIYPLEKKWKQRTKRLHISCQSVREHITSSRYAVVNGNGPLSCSCFLSGPVFKDEHQTADRNRELFVQEHSNYCFVHFMFLLSHIHFSCCVRDSILLYYYCNFCALHSMWDFDIWYTVCKNVQYNVQLDFWSRKWNILLEYVLQGNTFFFFDVLLAIYL